MARSPESAHAAPSQAEPATTTAAASAFEPPPSDTRSPGTDPASAATQAPPHEGPPGLHVDFSNAESLSKKFDDPERDVWQRPAEVIERMHIPAGSSVADLGTGTGYFVERLSRSVGPKGTVFALDVEPNMVAFVQRRAAQLGLGNVQARVVAPDDPGLAPASVARVLIVDTWHHIDDRGRYAQKLARALQPGGEVWVVDFTLESKRGPPVRHRLAPERVVQELEAGGLHAQLVPDERLPDQYIVRGVR